ncbi:hypothetical protein GCM10010221_58810 [Streptomyces parvus]|nr:hypothetical protein GCM10010221_58810 [Streptomyces parvus]
MQGDDAGDGEAGDQGEQVQLVLNVEVVRRFVQEEFTGLLGQGAGDLDALAFSAGQGVPGLPGAVREPGAPQRVGDGVLVGAVRGGPGAPVRDPAEAYDVEDAEVDLGDRVLVDDGDPAGDGASAETGEGVAVQGDDAGVRGEEAREDPQQGGFSGAVGAEESDGRSPRRVR